MKTLAFITLCLITATAALAQYTVTIPNVTMDFQAVSIREALATLFQDSDYGYILTPDVPKDFGKVTLKLENVGFDSAFEKLIEATKPALVYYRLSERGGFDYSTYRGIDGLPKRLDYLIGLAHNEQNPLLKINLKLNSVRLRDALARVFKGTGYAYVFNFDNDDTVTATIKNASLVQALDAICTPNGLSYKKIGEAGYVISGGQRPRPVGATATTRTYASNVTIDLSPMAVKDALAKIEPGWTFGGNLGSATIPAISLHNFPMRRAAAYVLIAAGLIPPTDGTQLVKSKGKVSIAATFRSPAIMGTAPIQSSAPAIYSPASGLALGTAAVAARRANGPRGSWLYTVLAAGAYGNQVLGPLFAVTGTSNAIGLQIPSATVYLSAQLYDLTLDQLLDNVLPALGMSFEKKGQKENPTYVISPKQISTKGAPSSSSPK